MVYFHTEDVQSIIRLATIIKEVNSERNFSEPSIVKKPEHSLIEYIEKITQLQKQYRKQVNSEIKIKRTIFDRGEFSEILLMDTGRDFAYTEIMRRNFPIIQEELLKGTKDFEIFRMLAKNDREFLSRVEKWKINSHRKQGIYIALHYSLGYSRSVILR